MIIGVCGNGYCGSSAVTDYLRENSDIAVCPYDIEFMFLYDVDGIDDLRHHIIEKPVRFYSSDAAIKRYKTYIHRINSPNSDLRRLCGSKLNQITDSYLDSIVSMKWNGWWHYDVYHSDFWTRNWNFRFLPRLNQLRQRLKLKPVNLLPDSEMYFSINPENFDQKTKDYVSDLVSLFNPDQKKIVVLDQPFPCGRQSVYEYYFSEPIKSITVLRDPRDVYLAAKCVVGTYSSWIPTNTVEAFIDYFKLLMADQGHSCNAGLCIYFEDMVYHYKETTARINTFIGITGSATKQYFDPARSINNTQLFRKFTQYHSDIAVIEAELKDYLYDYSQINITPAWENSF